MVTIKRKINTESDKYGGFSEIEVKSPSETAEIGSSYAQYKDAEAQVNYTSKQQTAKYYEEPNDYDKYQQEPQASYDDMTVNGGELMPRIISDNKDYSARQSEKKEKLDSRTKLILGIYIAIIVALSALVIGTGIAISSTDARIGALESEISAKNAIVAAQLTEIATLSDEDAITGRAYNNGMERAEEVSDVELLPMGEERTYEGVTNWFDSFCDWLN